MALVVDSWLDSYRTSHAAGMIAMQDWRVVMTRQVQLILARPGVEVHVAYHPGDTDHVADLYGWLCLERGDPPLVVYCYTKQHYRRIFGIQRGLFAAAGIDPNSRFEYAAKTGVVSKLASKIPNARWNPLRIRFAPKP
jgi:hypothetical protein